MTPFSNGGAGREAPCRGRGDVPHKSTPFYALETMKEKKDNKKREPSRLGGPRQVTFYGLVRFVASFNLPVSYLGLAPL